MSNIWVAAADNKIDEVKALIGTGNFNANSKDPNGFTPIHAAASYGNIELLKYLLTEAGGDVNIQDSDGDTPLHHTENLEVAKFLIENFNADFKIKNNDGLNVKEYCMQEEEFPELIKFYQLLEVTGDTNAQEVDAINTLPNGQEVKAFLMEDNEDNTEEMIERRKQVEAIFGNTELTEEQRDEKLRNYVMNVVSDNIGMFKDTSANEESNKRQK